MEEGKEPEIITTEGGYEAIKKGNLYLRNSINGRRLIEDGETFEEYKVRRKMVKIHLKTLKQGNLFFRSQIFKPETMTIVSKTYKKEEDASKE